MRTVTCTITFDNGATVTAKAAARTENERVIFQFSGDLSRIGALPEKGTLGFLEWYLTGCAANFGGELKTIAEGAYQDGQG